MNETSLRARLTCATLLALALAAAPAARAYAQDASAESDAGAADGETEETEPEETAPAETESAPAEPEAEQAPTAESGGSLAAPTGDGDGEGEGEGEAAPADDEAAAEEAQAAREPLAWRNSFFTWTHGITPNTFLRDAQLSYNPTYYWSFSLTPRWYLAPTTFFWVNQSLSWELTDDDGSAANNREPQLSDTLIEIRHTIPWEGFIFIPAARLGLPASKLSQTAQRYFLLGVGGTAVRVIPEAWSLTIGVVAAYRYWFAGTNTPQLRNPIPGTTEVHVPFSQRPPTVDGVPEEPQSISQASSLTSVRQQILLALTLNVTPLPGFNVSLAGFWVSQEGHGLGGASYGVDTSPSVETIGDQSATHWRHAYYLSLSLAYDVQPWMNVSVGWGSATVVTPLFTGNQVTSPFNPDNNFFLSTTFQIDGIYEAVAGSEDDGLTPEQRQRRRQGLARTSGAGGTF